MPKIYSHDVKLIKRKSKKMRLFVISLFIMMLILIISFGGIGVSNFLSKKGFTWFKTNKLSITSLNYYVVHFGEFNTEEESVKCSLWTLNSGGSSYIYGADKYLVVAQIYNNVDDANSVIENLSKDLTYTAEIKQFKSQKHYFEVDNISVADKRKLNKSINLTSELINSVLEISNKLDKGILSKVMASSEINSLKSDMKINKTYIDSINSNYNNSQLSKISNIYMKAVDSLDICVNKLLTSENYLSACKYCASEIFFNFYDFMLNF